MEMTEILVYLRGPLLLIFRQITPVSIKLFKKESSQFSELPEDFKAYLASKDKLYKLKKFEHNRFNVIFENAGAVVYHKDDIID
jgi:hypothetical protein